MSQPTCCKCRARPCRCKNYCQCGARIRGDQYRCGPCHEVYLATLPPEPDPAAEIARLQAELAAKDAALAALQEVETNAHKVIADLLPEVLAFRIEGSKRFHRKRFTPEIQAAIEAHLIQQLDDAGFVVTKQARAAHGAKEQA